MLHTLYLLCIAPLEFLMRLILEWGFSWTHSWGWSLVLLSLAVNTAILPIYNWAEGQLEEERKLRRGMSRHEAMLRASFKGQERLALVSCLRRLSGCDWRLSLRASAGLLVRIPFFIAAFHLLSEFAPLRGQSFGPLSDLAAPDALLGGVNLLPFVMTAANLLAAFVYAYALSRSDRVRIYCIALLFLVLLYPATSALVLYWTLNNVYSLCLTIIEKFWRWRPGRYRFQEFCSEKRSVAAAGRQRSLRRRLLVAVGCSLSVGAFFWLYICTQAFIQRYRVLDAEFNSAIWQLASQYAVMAIIASPFLTGLVPAQSRRRPVLHTLLLCVSVAVLFLPQSRFLKASFSATQGGLFGLLADGRSCEYFALWALSMFGIAKFRDRLAGVAANLRNIIQDGFRPSTERSGREQGTLPIPVVRDTVILACLMGTLCGMFLWFFIPFSTYFHNVNEFDFSGWHLFKAVLPYGICSIFVVSMVLLISSRIFTSICIRIPWKLSSKTGANINLVYVVLALFILYLLVSGTLLSFNLPILNGDKDGFDSVLRIIIDICFLIELILIAFRYFDILIEKFFMIIFFIVIISLTSLAEDYFSSSEKIDISKFNGNNGLYFVDDDIFFSQLSFSKTDNIIILLVDTLDIASFEKTLEIYPDLKKAFEGFWLFSENLGTGGGTRIAIASILQGKVWDPSDVPLGDFTREAFVSKDSIGYDALSNGREVFINTDSINIISKVEKNKTESISINKTGNSILFDHFYELYFRFMPYLAKMVVLDRVNFVDKYTKFGGDSNKIKFSSILNKIYDIRQKPVLQFIYFFGVHKPLIKEDIISTTKEFIIDFRNFVEKLKENNIYDQTVLIVMADHGDHGTDRRQFSRKKMKYHTCYFPVLLIKPKESNGNMMIREDLMSSSYIKSMLKDFYNNNQYNTKALEEFTKSLPPIRYVYQNGKMEVTGTYETMIMTKSNSLSK